VTTVQVAAPRDALGLIHRLRLPDGRELAETLPADPWLEEKVLRPVLARDEAGLPVHRLAYIELARGHFKTGAAAAVSIAEALLGPGTDVYAVAADLDQARLLAEAIEGQRRRNPALARALIRRTADLYVTASGGSKIRILSSDAPSAFGLAVDCQRIRVIADELTMWPRPDLYHSMITMLPKVADSQMIIISNAGVSPGQSWQWAVREAARQHGYLFSAEGTIASWIRPEQLAQVEASVPPPVFERFYKNRWTEETGTFVSMEMWDACCDPALPSLVDDRSWVVMGVDAAVTGDCFGVVAVTRDPNRPADAIAVRDVRVWTPPVGGSIDFTGPWSYLMDFTRAHRVIQIAYDPYQLHDFMTRFQRERGVWCREFGQQAERSAGDSGLFQLIRGRRLRHNGDPILREHIGNCGFKVAANEDTKARLVKRGAGKIDLAVSLSMGSAECLRLIL